MVLLAARSLLTEGAHEQTIRYQCAVLCSSWDESTTPLTQEDHHSLSIIIFARSNISLNIDSLSSSLHLMVKSNFLTKMSTLASTVRDSWVSEAGAE
jgi:hypothetical protein